MPSIYLAIKNKSYAEKMLNDARELILHIDSISSIGEDARLKRLDEYIRTPLDEISEFLEDYGASVEETEKEYEDVWYEPKEGVKLLTDYINVVKGCHSLSERTKRAIIPELKAFYDILMVLSKENNKWRLQYDI